MEHIWKLKDSSYGFALLDGEWSWILILSDFLNPFTRFYLEGYLQTVLTTNLGLDIYKRLVNKIPEKETNHDISYQKLAKFFEMSAEFGGVRLTLCLFVCLSVCVCVCVCVCVFTVVSDYY